MTNPFVERFEKDITTLPPESVKKIADAFYNNKYQPMNEKEVEMLVRLGYIYMSEPFYRGDWSF